MAAIGLYADAAAFGFKAFTQENDIVTQEPEELYRHAATEHKNVQGPWSCVQEDFVVVAEFSEVTGPIPLLTIPSHVAHNTSFSINDFIMKIMSIDYHANPSGHFQRCEDVQVLLTETGLSAYVHYTMLHDLKARGWVRPLCIAYVSRDTVKLERNFSAFRTLFLQMTEIMKFDNCHWFMDEILDVIRSLKETQGQYFVYRKREEDGVPLSIEEQQVMDKMDVDLLVHQYTEYKHLLHTVEPLLRDACHRRTVDAWKTGLMCAEQDVPQVAQYLSCLRQESEPGEELPMVEARLKSILGLCPWGLAAAVWDLLSTLQSHATNHTAASTTTLETQASVDDAVKNAEFLDLLATITQPLDDSLQRSCDEANTVSSTYDGTASSSYHSVAGSVSELPRDPDQLSDGDSFLDISETVHTDDSDGSDESCEEDGCVWERRRQREAHSGRRLLKFFRAYDKVACHVVYSLLIGRTVVISGSETSDGRVARLISALTPLVPVATGQRPSTLTWHCGILVSSHIAAHQLIGLCVPERLSIHDMISPRDKNTVTVVDIESKQLFGPAYSGSLLSALGKTVASSCDDHGLRLHLRYVAACIQEKLFLLQDSLTDRPNDVLKDLRLQGCDVEIIKFFTTIKCI